MAEQARYGSLRTIARIFRVMAWIVVVLGGLAVLGGTVNAADRAGSGQAFFVLVFGALGVALYSLMFFAAAEFIHLMIDVESNTRRAAEALAGGPPPPPPGA